MERARRPVVQFTPEEQRRIREKVSEEIQAGRRVLNWDPVTSLMPWDEWVRHEDMLGDYPWTDAENVTFQEGIE